MFFRAFPWRLYYIYIKFELLSPEIYSILENKDILIRFKVYGKVQQLHKRTETDNDGRTVKRWSGIPDQNTPKYLILCIYIFVWRLHTWIKANAYKYQQPSWAAVVRKWSIKLFPAFF